MHVIRTARGKRNMWYKPSKRPPVPSPDFLFAHSYDGYKFVLGLLLWGASLLLFIGMIVELITTSTLDQVMDETTFPTGIYLLLIAVVMLVQPVFAMCQLVTITADTPEHECTLAQMTFFGWCVNLVCAFIQFCIVTRGVFTFIIVVLFVNTLTFFAYVYFQYETHVRKNK
jgi:hypothetical protein